MIVTRILGGLGNQMFQYAMGRAMAHRIGTSLVLDTSWYDKGRPEGDACRSFGLDAFQIRAHVLPAVSGGIPEVIEPGKPCTFCLGSLPNKSDQADTTLIYLKQRRYPFDFHAMSASDGVYLDGFWQSEEHFNDVCDLIRSEFALSCPLSDEGEAINAIILAKQSLAPLVSIHVRRGDYVTNPQTRAFHGCLDRSWYASAIHHMKQRFPEASFVVFSDDIAWCRKVLPVCKQTLFVPSSRGSDAEDIVLMSRCTHHIIANSSFSWWGAWLNYERGKVVIAPRRWTSAACAELSPVPAEWFTI